MKAIDFRAIIQKELARRQMGVPKLARDVGCNQMTIYNYLAGRTEMKADLLARVLVALDLQVGRAG